MACKHKNCSSCLVSDRREANVDRARATELTVICTKCGNPMTTAVGFVLATRGLVLCKNCDGRHK